MNLTDLSERRLLLSLCKTIAGERSNGGQYLAKNFPKSEILNGLFCTYSFISQNLQHTPLDIIDEERALIWDKQIGKESYRITLNSEMVTHGEGDLNLEFFSGNTSLYLLSFSVIPAKTINLPLPRDSQQDKSIFIGCIQGRGGVTLEMRNATKAMSELAPAAALFSALVGFADAFSIGTIIGPSSTNHPSFNSENAVVLERNYDEFFKAMGASGPSEGYFFNDVSATLSLAADSANKGPKNKRERRRLKFELMTAVRERMMQETSNGRIREPSEIVQRLRRALGIREKYKLLFSKIVMEYIILLQSQFDREYYVSEYPDIKSANLDPYWHYLYHGAKEGRRPNPTFDTEKYKAENASTNALDLNPLVHLRLYGIEQTWRGRLRQRYKEMSRLRG